MPMSGLADSLAASHRRGMEILNHLAAPLAQSAAVVKQQTTDKSRQIRRAQTLQKNVAASSDTFEHGVESAEELSPVHDPPHRESDPHKKGRSHPPPQAPEEEPPHLDIIV